MGASISLPIEFEICSQRTLQPHSSNTVLPGRQREELWRLGSFLLLVGPCVDLIPKDESGVLQSSCLPSSTELLDILGKVLGHFPGKARLPMFKENTPPLPCIVAEIAHLSRAMIYFYLITEFITNHASSSGCRETWGQLCRLPWMTLGRPYTMLFLDMNILAFHDYGIFFCLYYCDSLRNK